MVKFWSDVQAYRYPYCATQLDYYTSIPTVKTTAPAKSYGGGSCGANEWADESYDKCQLVYPGFTSPNSKTPSEALVEGQYSMYDSTGGSITSSSCPASSSILMHGAVNELQACRLWEVGQCAADSTAAPPAGTDYCQSG